MIRRHFNAPILFVLLGAAFSPAAIFAQTDFYKGKNLTIIQGRDPGGSGDLRTKALVSFLQKYIPGNPTIVMEYMAGAGGRKAANYLYRSARPDGLTIGNPSVSMISSAVMRSFRIAGTPFVVPPGTPKDRVAMLQEGFRKTYQDPEFFREYKG
jgi:tripartite-type tricarboxylate transporter receptor subunit TctC